MFKSVLHEFILTAQDGKTVNAFWV